MFKRIIYNDWTGIIPIISFWLTFGVFIAICIRTLLLKKSSVEAMKQLPLHEDPSPGSAVSTSSNPKAGAFPHRTSASANTTHMRTGDGAALPKTPETYEHE